MWAGWFTICPDRRLLQFWVSPWLYAARMRMSELCAHSNLAIPSMSPPKMPFQRSPVTSHCGMIDTASLLSTPLSGIPWSWPFPHPWNLFFWLLGQPPTLMPSFSPAPLAAPNWSPSPVSPCLPTHVMLQFPCWSLLFSLYVHSPGDLTSLVTWIPLMIPNITSSALTSPCYECQVSLNGQKCSRRRDLFS